MVRWLDGLSIHRNAPPPGPFWAYYFNVDALDAAIERVLGAGGKVMNGPMEVPGPMFIANCQDPQGTWFSMVAPQR